MDTDIRFLAHIKIILSPVELTFLHKVISKASVDTDEITIHSEIFAKLEYLTAVIKERGQTREL